MSSAKKTTGDSTLSSPYYFQLRGLSIGYHGQTLIHDINIGVRKGEILTLIGPNGSGKSTLLKSITRQLKLIAGEVVFEGQDLSLLSYRQLSSRISVVLTERLKPELMTCHDIVATGRYPYTDRLGHLTHEDEVIVEEAMASVHAEDIGTRDFNSISDGQRQRVLLARAICQEPDIMILDEPTSYLDVRYKLDLLSILRDMAKEKGITVIMSLHEIDLAMKISDTIACIKGETVFRYGEPEIIFEEGLIRELYDIESGSFDPLFGSVELPRATGEPEAFVLSSCGTGIPVYRRLLKQDTPFAAGILHTNDVDYQVARPLAVDIITAQPFDAIDDKTYHRALDTIARVPRVIDAGVSASGCNARMADVLAAARGAGKLCTSF